MYIYIYTHILDLYVFIIYIWFPVSSTFSSPIFNAGLRQEVESREPRRFVHETRGRRWRGCRTWHHGGGAHGRMGWKDLEITGGCKLYDDQHLFSIIYDVRKCKKQILFNCLWLF